MNPLILALLLGTLFGYVLFLIGAADAEEILDMLKIKQLRLMKSILLAIGFAAVLMFSALLAGWLDPTHFAIKTLSPAVLIGGAIFGLGWGLGGFCPGTALSGLGGFRLDALFYVIGGLVGALLFNQVFSTLAETAIFTEWLGGKVTLFEVTTDFPALVPVGAWAGILFGLALMAVAWMLPTLDHFHADE